MHPRLDRHLDFTRAFFNLDVLLVTGEQRNLCFLTAVEYRGRRALDVQPDGPDGIVVAWDQVADTIRLAVGVDYCHHGNAQEVGLGNGNRLLTDIDHEHGIG